MSDQKISSPLDVLRDAAFAAAATHAGPSDISTDDYDALVVAAVDDVEKLVEAARELVDIGDEQNRCRICWALWGEHEDDCELAPFAP